MKPTNPTKGSVISRRTLLGSFIAGASFFTTRKMLGSNRVLDVDLLQTEGGDRTRSWHSQYRADAAILLFGVTIFHRAGVGRGYVRLAQSTAADGDLTAIDFGAGSLPEKTRGLNRQGFLREVLKERNGSPVEAAYFGALVSSNEDDLDHAKQSLATSSEALLYKAIDGYHREGHSRSVSSRFLFPSRYTWNEHPLLVEAARASFPQNDDWRQSNWPGETAAPTTFLQTLRRLVDRPEKQAEARYVYGEKEYKLRIEKSADEHMGRDFASRRLVSAASGVLCVRGKTVEVKNGKQSTFQLWIERPASNPLPLRFEYQPKSFLRLAFELEGNPEGKGELARG